MRKRTAVTGARVPATRQSRSAIILVLCGLAIILDGFDNQLLGIVIPALGEEFGQTRAAFVPVAAASLLAMSIGTILIGIAGDRIGRRPALIGSVFLFGVGTLASAFADGLFLFGSLRALAALGLGGAMPNATALLAEYASARHRSLMVTVGIVCVPVGGVIAGLLAAYILPSHGWRMLLGLGGVLPLAAALLMLAWLPEAPNFRARAKGAIADQDARRPLPRALPLAGIFAPGMRRDALSLWTAFFFCLLAVYAVFSWMTTLLVQEGFGIAVASSGLAAFNFGGVFGALVGATTMDRFGSRRPMTSAAVGGAIFSGLSAVVIISPCATPFLIIAALAVQGMFVTALQIMLFALAAGIYGDDDRTTGVGAALGVGRLGAVVSALAGSLALGFGSAVFMALIAAAMCLSALALAVLRRHFAGAESSARPPA